MDYNNFHCKSKDIYFDMVVDYIDNYLLYIKEVGC